MRNYKRLLYFTLPDNLKNEVNEPNEYPDYGDTDYMNEGLDLLNSIDDGEEWTEPYVKEYPDIGRNDPCPCGSGKKYKKCCLGKN